MKRFTEWQRWATGGLVTVVVVVLVTAKQQSAAKQYQAEHQVRCTATAITPDQKRACAYEGDTANNYLSLWDVLFAWPTGVEAWAIIATGFAIAWQSSETRKSAKATLASVTNSNKIWKVQREKDSTRIGFSAEHDIDLTDTSPHARFKVSFHCPHTIFNPSLKVGAQVRVSSHIDKPDFMFSVDVDDRIEGLWSRETQCEIIGEGGIAQMSTPSKERLEAGEVVVVISAQFIFRDAYGGRDAMRTLVYRATQLRNFDGTRMYAWEVGPKSLNWNKHLDED